jgi:hypothetical protein
MEQSKKQTAIQELIDDLDYELKSRGMIVNWDMYLQTEKKQIIDAVDYGCDDYGSQKDGEEYYNQNYGTE